MLYQIVYTTTQPTNSQVFKIWLTISQVQDIRLRGISVYLAIQIFP